MALWVAVHGLTDGQDVMADTFNGAVSELTERTDYLYDQIQTIIGSGVFESIHISGITLAEGDAAPVIGDLVYLDPTTNTYCKAQAIVRLLDAFTAADSAYALGMLTDVDTVTVAGRVTLSGLASPFSTVQDLIQTGETFRAGPYYVSSLEAGKLTANPTGIRIYVGQLTAAEALLNPQYRDTGEAHQHRNYVLVSQPAGRQTGIDLTYEEGTHSIIGFPTTIEGTAGDVQPRLVCRGVWTGATATQYTIWMGTANPNVKPTDFSDLYLHWTSNDYDEDADSVPVRVCSYEQPVAIGTKGLIVSLENPDTNTDYSLPYYAPADDDQTLRQWIINVPDETQGWLARKYRQAFTAIDSASTAYTFRLFGGPAAYTDAIQFDTITITCTQSGDIAAKTADFSIVDAEGTTTWTAAEFWVPKQLANGLTVLVIPFDADGVATVDSTAVSGDAWETDITDEAPGANFEYAVGMQAALQQYYPPVPLAAAAVVMNGVELDSADLFPADPTYRAGWTTIYWYNNVYGTVPWPIDWVDHDTPTAGITARNCVFHFLRNAIGDSAAVTSLKAKAGSGLTVTRCGTGDAATVGDLEIGLDLSLAVSDTSRAGYKVVKAIEGQRMETGPVVEKIVAGTGLVVTQSSGAPAGQGTVRISLASETTYAGDFEEVALQNAKQELIGMFPYVRLLPWSSTGTNIPSAFVSKFRVPHTLPNELYRVVIYATVFGENAITDGMLYEAGVEFSYSILIDYTSLFTGEYEELLDNQDMSLLSPISSTPRVVNIPFGKTGVAPANTYAAFNPLLLHNNPTALASVQNRISDALGDPIPIAADLPDWPVSVPGFDSTPGVRPGTVVAVRFRRCAPAGTVNAYTGALGFINLRWTLVSAV